MMMTKMIMMLHCLYWYCNLRTYQHKIFACIWAPVTAMVTTQSHKNSNCRNSFSVLHLVTTNQAPQGKVWKSCSYTSLTLKVNPLCERILLLSQWFIYYLLTKLKCILSGVLCRCICMLTFKLEIFNMWRRISNNYTKSFSNSSGKS
jgi:hypothetical protein